MAATRELVKTVLEGVVKTLPKMKELGASKTDLAPVFALIAEVQALKPEPAASEEEIDTVFASAIRTVKYLKDTLRPRLEQRATVAAGTPAPGEAGSPETAKQAQNANELQAAASAVVALANDLNEAAETEEAAAALDAQMQGIMARGIKLSFEPPATPREARQRKVNEAYTRGRDLYTQRQNYQGAYQSWRVALDKLAELLSSAARSQKLGLLSIPMPPDLIGQPSSSLPPGVKAPPLTAEEKAADQPSAPVGAPSTDPPTPIPTVIPPVPSETDLIGYIKGAQFDLSEAMDMVRQLWPGFADMGLLRCAVASALRQYPGDHPDIYVFRWTTAAPITDLRGEKAKMHTVEIGNASPGPEGAVWRHVAIPGFRTGDQIDAYKAVGATTLDDSGYEALLRQSMQPGESEVPIMEGTTSPAEVEYQRFYIQADGVVRISNDVFLRLMQDDDILKELDEETFEDVFVGSWGRVYAVSLGDAYKLVGDPPVMANFLIVLDKMAKSLGAVSVSAAAVEVAEEEEEGGGWGWGAEEEEEEEVTVGPAPVVVPLPTPVSTVHVIKAQVVPASEDYKNFVRQMLRLSSDVSIGIYTDRHVADPAQFDFKLSVMDDSRAKINITTKRLNGEGSFDVLYNDDTGWRFHGSGQIPIVDFATPANILGQIRVAIDASDMFLDEVKMGNIIGGAAEGRAAQNADLLFKSVERYVLERLKEQKAPQYWLEN